MGTRHYFRQNLASVNQKKFYFHLSPDFIENLNALAGQEKVDAARAAVGQAGHKVFKTEARKIVRKYKGPLNRGWYKYGYKGKKRVPGTMMKSIVFQLNKNKQEMNGIFSVKDPLGHLIEYGHVTRKGLIKSGLLKGFQRKTKSKGKSFVPAFPFMRPTITSKSEAATEQMAKVLRKFILNPKG